MSNNKSIVAERLLERRLELGYTQGDVAEMIGIGDRSLICNYEASRRFPRVEMLFLLAKALDTSVAFLIGEVDEPE